MAQSGDPAPKATASAPRRGSGRRGAEAVALGAMPEHRPDPPRYRPASTGRRIRFDRSRVDLSDDLLPETIRHVPLNVWFRFRRAVEDSPTVLMLLDQESNAKTCASLVLRLHAGLARWFLTPDAHAAPLLRHPAAYLLDGLEARAEVISSRMQPAIETPSAAWMAAAGSADHAGIFASKALWGYFSGVPMERSELKGRLKSELRSIRR